MKYNTDFIIEWLNKGSAKFIMDKKENITEGHRQLSNTKLSETQFYEPTGIDLTGEVIQTVNLHVHGM